MYKKANKLFYFFKKKHSLFNIINTKKRGHSMSSLPRNSFTLYKTTFLSRDMRACRSLLHYRHAPIPNYKWSTFYFKSSFRYSNIGEQLKTCFLIISPINLYLKNIDGLSSLPVFKLKSDKAGFLTIQYCFWLKESRYQTTL